MKYRCFGRALCLAVTTLLVACGDDKRAATDVPAPPPATVDASAATQVPSSAAPIVAAPAAVVASAAPSPGEKVYYGTCALCHGSPAMGAPVAGNKADWEPRIAQGKDVLYTHALQGFTGSKGAMPARGGNPSLDDAAVQAAVDYLVDQVK